MEEEQGAIRTGTKGLSYTDATGGCRHISVVEHGFFTRFNPFKKITKFFIDPAIKPATTTHMTEATTTTPAEKGRLFGMQIPADLDAELSRASAKLNLTKSALARLALQRGLVVVMEQLEGQTTEAADA